MSIEHILIGKHHGGSDYWRTPFLLFKNLHREFGFTIDGTATEHVIQDCSKVGLKFS